MNFRGGQKPSKITRSNSNTGPAAAEIMEPQPLTSTSEPAGTGNDDDMWGDDDDDNYLWIATQIAERQEGICGTKNPSPPVVRGIPRVNSFAACGVPPAEQLSLRRQRLENNDDDFSRILGGKDSIGEAAQEKIEALEQQIEALKNDNHRLKGETSIIRRNCDKMKLENQEESKRRILTENETKKKISEMTIQYRKDLEGYKSKLQENSQMLLNKTFPAHKSPIVIAGNTSVINPNAFLEPASQQPCLLNESLPIKTTLTSLSSITRTEDFRPLTVTKEVQTDTIVQEHVPSKINGEVQSSNSMEQIRVGLEDEDSIGRLTSEELRENMFRSIEQIVELRYQSMLPTLERVAKEAPKEIMRRLVRCCEVKSAFPDVVDSMFQWGIDKERKRIRAATGIMEPTLPTLPGQYEPGVYFYEIKIGIEMRFKNTGAWGALVEVREWLEQVLKSLEGDGRFRMYEPNTLMNFWRLLFWANELWRCILFEEENEELVERHKQMWVKELQGWTGLVLKCDWRDYFVIELEVEVRKLTLNILESIVTAGYFEQTKNRYEILYRVLKDALSKDAFRDARNVQHILKIVTWSVSDVMIIKHLCYKTNEGNCLARLIGENLLKVCREETDPTTVAVIYLDYLYLLESLMMDKSVAHHHSKLARSESKIRQHSQALEQSENDSAMDCDFMGTQLACPVKYSTTAVPQQVELSDEDLNCWLDPVKYEDPYWKLRLCQCRKVMMGTAIFVLHAIFGFWRQSCRDYEANIEARHVEEQEELEVLERTKSSLTRPSDVLSSTEQKYVERQKERLKFLRDKKAFLVEFLPKVNQALGKTSAGDTEWHWDDILRKGREIATTPLPQWLSDYKRQGNVLDLCISKGIFLMNFLRTRSENLAAAIGTEAYKEYMILIPLLRLHMDKLDLNRVNYGILASITPECEEDHLFNNNSDGNTQSQYPSPDPEDVEGPQKIEYNLSLKELTAADCKELQRTSTNDMKKMQAAETSTAEVESTQQSLFTLRRDEFLCKSGFVQNP